MGFSLGKTLSGAFQGFVSSGGNPAGAAIGAVGGALDSYQDKSALNYQNKQNIKLWNMQNEYNTPKAQMQRYIDAGLNPNLIYTQQNTAGDIAGGTLGSSDSLGSANQLANGSSNRMVQRQQLLNMETSRRQTEAGIEQIHNNIENANELLPYQIALMKAQEQQIRLNNETSPWLTRFFGKTGAKRVQTKLENPTTAEKNPGWVLFRYQGQDYGF